MFNQKTQKTKSYNFLTVEQIDQFFGGEEAEHKPNCICVECIPHDENYEVDRIISAYSDGNEDDEDEEMRYGT